MGWPAYSWDSADKALWTGRGSVRVEKRCSSLYREKLRPGKVYYRGWEILAAPASRVFRHMGVTAVIMGGTPVPHSLVQPL